MREKDCTEERRLYYLAEGVVQVREIDERKHCTEERRLYYLAEGVVQVREIEERKRLYRGEEAVLPCWGRSSGTLSCKESMALFRFSYNTTRATV